ncbi:FMN reductase [Microbacteriaceae bacterium SG_E_30_P1]|uniref:FMN reductase n=1 Tax=Antiquaquibacter oligotrophicus TaxID=2880260 RepID=A0ABT6KMK4_9MICO|nr:FMN reductase [Antiquaquibacter oligotrophicus]MDH6180668.1 FMN reductase [Antiquaquibacter oligotrophicus]UDF13604.1 FMN reductase [Antiquaquibacter oligotrophicus]
MTENTTRKITVVSSGLSQPSSTRLLADRIATATASALDGKGVTTEITVIELRDLAQDITNNLLTGFAPPRLQAAIDTLTESDGLIAVTPVFTTSYSGLFKSFVDVLDPQSITGLPVLLAATGGTERHSLVIDYAMRPLFTYLHAVPVSTGVYAASSDWGSAEDALPRRIERAASELAALVEASDRSQHIRDPFALPEGFSPVGGFGAQ